MVESKKEKHLLKQIQDLRYFCLDMGGWISYDIVTIGAAYLYGNFCQPHQHG